MSTTRSSSCPPVLRYAEPEDEFWSCRGSSLEREWDSVEDAVRAEVTKRGEGDDDDLLHCRADVGEPSIHPEKVIGESEGNPEEQESVEERGRTENEDNLETMMPVDDMGEEVDKGESVDDEESVIESNTEKGKQVEKRKGKEKRKSVDQDPDEGTESDQERDNDGEWGDSEDDSEEGGTRLRSTQPPSFAVVDGIIRQIWNDLTEENKETARNAYTLLVDLYVDLPHFRLHHKLSSSQTVKGAHIIISNKLQNNSSVHTSVMARHDVNGEVVSGFQVILGLAVQLNNELKNVLDEHLSKGSVRPLSSDLIERVSMGNARRSTSVGVYFLKYDTGKYIIGHSCGSSFFQRLCGTKYSDSELFLKSLIPERSKLDHRMGRTDHILVDLDGAKYLQKHQKWVASAIEATMIVLWNSTNSSTGLNTNVIDDGGHWFTFSARNLLQYWERVKTITDSGDVRIPGHPSTGPEMEHFVKKHLSDYAEYVAIGGLWAILRCVHRLVTAHGELFPHFRPLKQGAWANGPPRNSRWEPGRFQLGAVPTKRPRKPKLVTHDEDGRPVQLPYQQRNNTGDHWNVKTWKLTRKEYQVQSAFLEDPGISDRQSSQSLDDMVRRIDEELGSSWKEGIHYIPPRSASLMSSRDLRAVRNKMLGSAEIGEDEEYPMSYRDINVEDHRNR